MKPQQTPNPEILSGKPFSNPYPDETYNTDLSIRA